MFTGIIEATGKLTELTRNQGDLTVRVSSPNLDMGDVQLGDSIATNGVCLTVVEKFSDGFRADVSNETLKLTQFAQYKLGQTVNLEKALQPISRLGGHLVSGHIDGIATVAAISPNARATEYWLEAPSELMKYIPYKGSVAIDGISLTVNEIKDCQFKLTIVPHTAAETTMESFKAGRKVNLEVDVIARYLERLMLGEKAADKKSEVTMDLLAKTGFLG
mgnify:CR=1 FL=1